MPKMMRSAEPPKNNLNMHHYGVAGLSLASELALPAFTETAAPSDAPDITVAAARLPQHLAEGEQRGPGVWTAPGQILINVPGVVRMRMTQGRSLEFEAEDHDPSDVAIFLSATGVGTLLHQRNLAVLHASAVLVGGAAVLFCGPSGAGKSTLAAALNKSGYPLIADDICVIRLDESGRPLVRSDGPRLKLWQHAVERLGLDGRQSTRVRPGIEKHYVHPGELSPGDVPVAAIYRLHENRLTEQPVIEAAHAAQAAKIIVDNAYRPRIAALLGHHALYLDLTARIAARGGVFELRRPFGFGLFADVEAALKGHWACFPAGVL